jgi:hypothetical protein
MQADSEWLSQAGLIITQCSGNLLEGGHGNGNKFGHSTISIQSQRDVLLAEVGSTFLTPVTLTTGNPCTRSDPIPNFPTTDIWS